MNNIMPRKVNIKINDELRLKAGGKAYGLFNLIKNKINVPPWSVLTSDFFKEIRKRNAILDGLIRDANEKKACLIRDKITSIDFTEEESDNLKKIFNSLKKTKDAALAVRSSGVSEDTANLSFAGQMDSFLNITGFDEMKKAVKKCWASLYNDRAVLYRKNNGISIFDAGFAVIIQEMINAEVSGVMFTANILNGSKNEILISAVWGLGEGLVSGALDADTYITDKKLKLLKKDIAVKKHKIIYGKKSGTIKIKTPSDLIKTPALDDKTLKSLAAAGIRIEKFSKKPMDVEFVIRNKKVYIVQARPVTCLKQPDANNMLVWDNSNIVESYCGVTTPLTFSFIKMAYQSVYDQFCKTLGVDGKKIKDNRHIFGNMLGLINGRVYYNLINWYKLAAMLPGFEYNKAFMEQMMGLQKIRDYITDNAAPEKNLFKYLSEMFQLIKTGIKMIFTLLTLSKKVKKFFKRFYGNHAYYSSLDYSKMTSKEIMNTVREIEKNILQNWKEPILNDLKTMIFYGVLKNLTVKWDIDGTCSIQNELLAGEDDIKSKKAVTELFKIALNIRNNAALKKAFRVSGPKKILIMVKDGKFPEFKNELERYLKEYGARSIEEMKLESVPAKDDPEFLIAMLANYVNNNAVDPDEQRKKELAIRKNAEEAVHKKLKSKKFLLVLSKLKLYNYIVKLAREAVKDRENQRFCRSESYALVRNIINAIALKWVKKNIIAKAKDIYYLQWDEIWSFIEGTSVTHDLKSLIALRKKEFAGFKKISLEDHIETTDEVYADPGLNKKNIKNIKTPKILKGTGCCAGIVENKVKIVLKPDSNLKLNGEIMAAKQTDPGWAVIFPLISGMIIEKGSLLSHSAIVAREMGIPTAVGVKNATSVLKKGFKVRLNGSTGEIVILKKKQEKKNAGKK